jgi:hypothetical protein
MSSTYNLLINAGVAGVFAVFTIILVDRFMKFTTTQTAMWKGFLKEEAKQRERIMDDAIGKLEKLDTTMEELCKLVETQNDKDTK